jgi:hypothetical protein
MQKNNEKSKIPDSAQFTIEEYLTEREMSDIPVLLVEGEYDSIFFQLFQDELEPATQSCFPECVDILRHIEIDTPEIIKSPDGQKLGNREKVEIVCGIADSNPFTGMLAGFVDREFRGFVINECVYDDIGMQNQVGRILWSRGHSVENYLFDVQTLRQGLRDYGISSKFSVRDALLIFENDFDKILCIASAISLSARDNDLISAVQTSFDVSLFAMQGDSVSFDVAKWDKLLSQRQKLDEKRRGALIDTFNAYCSKLEASDPEVIRWVCHGHIGLAITWGFFHFCVTHVCQQAAIPKPTKQIRPVNKKDRFIKFTVNWIKNLLEQEKELRSTPAKCFEHLGVSLVNETITVHAA